MAFVADQFVLDTLFQRSFTAGKPIWFLSLVSQPDGVFGKIVNGPGELTELHLEALFNRCTMTHEEGVAYWRDCREQNDGYIVLYEDGEHLHTYHYPPNFL
jgi:hypothetical protein